jgi:hypothetical protein
MSEDNIDTEKMEEISDIPEMESTPEEKDELTTKEQKLEVDEEVSVYMNQLNLAQMMIMDNINKNCKEPIIKFIDDKFTIIDDDKVFMQGDWHFIGEFHTEKENPQIKGYEFVWSWGLRPDAEEDPHTKEVFKVTESLPYGLQPLTFPLVQFEDVGILELIKAYSFRTLDLDFIHIMFSNELNSYGIFGIYDVKFSDEIKKPSTLDKIVETAKKKAKELRKANPDLDGTEALKQAWRAPEVLSLVAAHQREKNDRAKASKEFSDFFKRAIMDPRLVLDNPDFGVPDEGQVVQEIDEKYSNALSAIENALDAVREEELAKMEQVGDDSED